MTFRKVGSYLKGFFGGAVFDTQGAVIGEPWKPLDQATIRQKRQKGYPATPLIGSGRMRRSFSFTSTSQMVAVYNTTQYFRYHQSRKPRRKLPRRVMLKLDEIRKQIIVKHFHQAFKKKIY